MHFVVDPLQVGVGKSKEETLVVIPYKLTFLNMSVLALNDWPAWAFALFLSR